jgi:hypothetical protein
MNDRAWANDRRLHSTEIIDVFLRIVSSGQGDETILTGHETILPLGRRRPETPDGYQVPNNNGGQRRRPNPETVKCEP